MNRLDEMGAGPVGGYSKNQLWDKIHRLEAERDEITKEFNKLADGLYAAHKAKEYLSDRDHWKARAEALERALRANEDERCYTCANFSTVVGTGIYAREERCHHPWPCEDGEWWQFDEARFAGGGDAG